MTTSREIISFAVDSDSTNAVWTASSSIVALVLAGALSGVPAPPPLLPANPPVVIQIDQTAASFAYQRITTYEVTAEELLHALLRLESHLSAAQCDLPSDIAGLVDAHLSRLYG